MTRDTFKAQIIATGVKSPLAEKEKPNIFEHDVKNIRQLKNDEQLIDILGGSIAPTIEGSFEVKKRISVENCMSRKGAGKWQPPEERHQNHDGGRPVDCEFAVALTRHGHRTTRYQHLRQRVVRSRPDHSRFCR